MLTLPAPMKMAEYRVALIRIAPIVWISALLASLPIASGLLFRTYWFLVEPDWYENLRQFDFPFYPAELAVVFIAHAQGMRFRSILTSFDRPARFATIAFLTSFWFGSAFLSEHPLFSLIRCFYFATHIGFGCAIYYLVRTAPARNVMVLAMGLAIGLVVYLPLIAVHFAMAPDPRLVRGGNIIWSSAIPGCLSVRHLGIYAAAILSLSAAMFVLDRNAKQRLWLGAVVFVSAATLFWSGTRAGIYGFVIASVVTTLVLHKAPSIRRSLVVLLLIALAMPLSLLWLPPDPSFGLFAIVSGGTNATEFGHGRLELWAQHWPLFLSSPWFGHGEGSTYWLTISGDMHHVQPHNALIQFVTAWGLIPTVAFGYLAWRAWRAVHREAARRLSVVPLAMMLNCLIVMSMVDGVLYFTRMTMLVATAVSLVMAARRREARA